MFQADLYVKALMKLTELNSSRKKSTSVTISIGSTNFGQNKHQPIGIRKEIKALLMS